MSTREKVGIGIMLGLIGILGLAAAYFRGKIDGQEERTPESVYQADVNQDGLQDIIVKAEGGEGRIFIQDSINHYKPFSEYSAGARGELEKSLEGIEKEAYMKVKASEKR